MDVVGNITVHIATATASCIAIHPSHLPPTPPLSHTPHHLTSRRIPPPHHLPPAEPLPHIPSHQCTSMDITSHYIKSHHIPSHPIPHLPPVEPLRPLLQRDAGLEHGVRITASASASRGVKHRRLAKEAHWGRKGERLCMDGYEREIVEWEMH